jgi:prevent-host-death family protein
MLEVLPMDTIRPSADLRNHYAELSRLCKESNMPVYVTVNGRGDTVLLSIAQYTQMRAELELLRMLSEAEDDVREGRVAPVQASFDGIRASLLKRDAP